MASKLACAGVRSAPQKAGSSFAVEREQAPSPQQARSNIVTPSAVIQGSQDRGTFSIWGAVKQ